MINIGTQNRWVILAGVLVVGVLALLILAFLPPFQLVQRVQGSGYTFLNADNPVVAHQDGLQIVASPNELDGDFGVKLDSVPQLIFLEGSAGAELKRAAESLPANLIVKSPFYKISTSGDAPRSTLIAVDIPNNAQPWETLDLYTWTGEGWEWVGGQVDADRALILAPVGTDVPEAVVVMQAGALPPAILAELPAAQATSTATDSGATHLLLPGLSLGERGGIDGDVTRLPLPTADDSFALMPSLRNWSEEGGGFNQATLADLLADPAARQAHIDAIVTIVVGQGYAGVDLDYRGVSGNWRDSFSDLIGELASALHAQGKILTVAVDLPSATPGGDWDTGGYDWRFLGQTADMLRVPFPTQDIESFATWALSQVSRYKLAPNLSALGSDRVGDQVALINLETALARLGDVQGPDGETVSPGETVKVDLGGALNTLHYDEDSQTFGFSYQDALGNEHQVTVATTASLAKTLAWALRYHLGGVFVSGMLDAGGDPTVSDIVRQFAAQAPPTTSDANALQVIWTVQGTSGDQLARENRPLTGSDSFEWTAPETPGEYVIKAAIAAQAAAQGVDQGSISVSIATAEPEPTPSPTVVAAATPTPTNRVSPSGSAAFAADCLNATYVADVTVPDNTRFEKGEAFAKTWRVRNSGTCPWPEGTRLVYIDGDALGAPESVQVETLEAGGTTDISVDMVAADADGNFKGVWRLADANGDLFGTRLTVVIRVGEEQAAVAPPPSGGGGAFELGGHIRTWNYVAQMKHAGMSWAKVQVHYGQDASGIVQTAHANGLKIQLSALGSPGMVVEPNFHADYTAWVANLARTGAEAIEVWNEPNIEREWQIGQISPAAYTQLLCASYNAIKGANPNTKVISAAPAPTGFFGGCSPNGCDDLPWLQGMYNAGALNCMDYIGAHHNAGATAPSATSGHPADNGGGHHSWYFLPQTRLYYNVFGGARKLFYTEMGYASQEGLDVFSDDFAWARGTNNAQQAAWLSEAVQLSRSTGMVANIIVWNIDFSRFGYDPQDGYAIIRPGGGCPACDALHAVMY